MTEEAVKKEAEEKTLDKESTEFLEKRMGAKINPQFVEESADYYRMVFYFKCCALQDEVGAPSGNAEIATINDCFFKKEKADALFEQVYTHALEFDKLINNQQSQEDLLKLMNMMESGMSAQTATTNDKLTSALHIDSNGRDVGNIQLMITMNMQQFSGYVNYMQTHEVQDPRSGKQMTLMQQLQQDYHNMVVKASAEIAPYLPKSADIEAYMPIVKEHPKAVLALATIGKAIEEGSSNSAYQKLVITSPEDLLKKSQQSNVVALADKLEFSNIVGSMNKMSEDARPMIGLGKEQKDFPIRRAMVNEG